MMALLQLPMLDKFKAQHCVGMQQKLYQAERAEEQKIHISDLTLRASYVDLPFLVNILSKAQRLRKFDFEAMPPRDVRDLVSTQQFNLGELCSTIKNCANDLEELRIDFQHLRPTQPTTKGCIGETTSLRKISVDADTALTLQFLPTTLKHLEVTQWRFGEYGFQLLRRILEAKHGRIPSLETVSITAEDENQLYNFFFLLPNEVEELACYMYLQRGGFLKEGIDLRFEVMETCHDCELAAVLQRSLEGVDMVDCRKRLWSLGTDYSWMEDSIFLGGP